MSQQHIAPVYIQPRVSLASLFRLVFFPAVTRTRDGLLYWFLFRQRNALLLQRESQDKTHVMHWLVSPLIMVWLFEIISIDNSFCKKKCHFLAKYCIPKKSSFKYEYFVKKKKKKKSVYIIMFVITLQTFRAIVWFI